MERNLKKIGLINVGLLLVVGAAGLAVSNFSDLLSGRLAAVFITLGFLVSLVSYFQMRLADRERIEKLEFDELTKSMRSATLFSTKEAEVFPAQRAREQFERWVVPVFTVILFLLQTGGAVLLWRWLPSTDLTPLNQPMPALSLFGLFALLLFLVGQYSVRLARLEKIHLLRPGASYILLGAYLCFLVLLAIAAVEAGFTQVDLIIARVLCVVLALIGLETLVNLVLDIYRPRVKGGEIRLLYESRLVGLLGQPEGLITTAAQALDYQFGFKVSETWFYRFLEKALAWLVLAQFGILLLSTCVVFVEPGEGALLERFGRPITLNGQVTLGPGPHLKWPWPIDRVQRFSNRRVQSLLIGAQLEDEGKEPAHQERTVVWTVKHAKDEFNFIVASRDTGSSPISTNLTGREAIPPVSLVSAKVPVQYAIRDLQAWAYNNASPTNLMEKLATREVVRYLVSVDLKEVMGPGRQEAGEELRRRIQQAADALNLGVDILYVGIEGIHPPVKVAPEYEAVVGALQQKEATIFEAKSYSAMIIPQARAQATNRVQQAEAYQVRKTALAAAQASQFTNFDKAFRAAPAVYAQWAYLQTLIRSSSGARKIVLGTTNTDEVLQLNLEEEIAPSLLKGVSSALPPPKK
jgi:regulator of protease activity HflC (stomatin/prohibitin superfamily)